MKRYSNRHAAGLRDWHGHDGGGYANAAALYKAIATGRYRGEWFIPPKDVLESLYRNQDKGALQGTFTTASVSGGAPWYWSCSEPRNDPSSVWAVDFTDGPSMTWATRTVIPCRRG
jgi:hypothetical protein